MWASASAQKMETSGRLWIKKAQKSRTLIINCLANGDWNRYNHIVSQTDLSTATVSKFLKELENDGEIQKKVDIDSGNYPYPAFYRLTAKGLERVNKDVLKRRIDEIPLEYNSFFEIMRQNIKAKVKVPAWYKKFDGLLSKLRLKEADERKYDWPTTYSVMSDSKLVDEWRSELYDPIKALLHEKHPKLEGNS